MIASNYIDRYIKAFIMLWLIKHYIGSLPMKDKIETAQAWTKQLLEKADEI